MCFAIHQDHSKEKIASNDITCYKRLTVHSKLIPPPMNITEELLSEIKFKTPFRGRNILLHKNPLKKSTIRTVTYWLRNYPNRIEEGLHSYSCVKKAFRASSRREVIVKCTIPIGSKYYYNPQRKEFVSNRLQYSTKLRTKCNKTFNISKKLIF